MAQLHRNAAIAREAEVPRAWGSAEVLGVRVDAITLEQLLQAIIGAARTNRRLVMSYANAHGINLAVEQPWFRELLNASDIVCCDGYGVKWGARLLGHFIPERLCLSDWLPILAQHCCEHDLSLFLLGAQPGGAEAAATRLQAENPGLRIVGVHHGHFNHDPDSAEHQQVLTLINQARPDLLLVGFGMPRQERWIFQNWGRLEVTVALAVGAGIDYVAGNVRRGPPWMTNNGLEWLARLLIEPGRLWQRYLLGNPLFLLRVLRQRLACRL